MDARVIGRRPQVLCVGRSEVEVAADVSIHENCCSGLTEFAHFVCERQWLVLRLLGQMPGGDFFTADEHVL